MGRFRACYEKALRQHPKASGTATLRFVIARSGHVLDATSRGMEHIPALDGCLARAAYGITFPQPEGGVVTVVYPLRLEPLPVPEPVRRYGYR